MGDKAGIHHIADLGISRLFAEISPETRNDFIRYVYKDNENKKLKPIFWETLQVFFDNNMNITDTAKKIYVHRNTLLYRLEKIKQFTALDPKKFGDALQLYLALQLNFLHKNK